MTNLGINYIVRQPDVNEEVVGEIAHAVELVGSGENALDISWSLQRDEEIAAIALSQIVSVESLAEYLHKADRLASAILERCSDEIRGEVQAAFAGVSPPDRALYQE